MDDVIYDIMIVVDTNVVLAGTMSRNGASYVVLRGMLLGTIPFAASPALILEYEDVLKRPGMLGTPPTLTVEEIDQVLDMLCERATPVSPWFRFRPFLSDPKDDFVVECAMAARARIIVSGDKHFEHPDVNAFGLQLLRPGEYVAELNRERRPT